MNKKYVLIDGNFDVMRASCVGFGMVTSEGQYTGGIHIFLNMLWGMRDEGTIIVVFDGGHSEFRTDLHPDYKVRLKSEKLTAEDVEEVRQTMSQRDYEHVLNEFQVQQTIATSFYWIPIILRELGITVVQRSGQEADDLIAYMARNLGKRGDSHVTVASEDKDYLQIIDELVRVYRPKEAKHYDLPEFIATYGFSPMEFIVYKAFLGDSSDNITGVKGIGAAKATTFIKHLELTIDLMPSEENPSTVNLMDRIKQVAETKCTPFIKTTVLNNLDLLDRNIKIMNLNCLDHLPEAEIEFLESFLSDVDELKSPDRSKVNTTTLIQTFTSLELKVAGAKWVGHLSR